MTMMNLYHDVPRGENPIEVMNVIVEIPRGSSNKYEIDKETGLIALDRANYTATPYPFDYAFVPQTLWEDGDALDVVVLSTYPLHVGVLVKVRPVALLEMTDSGESDYKIIAVPVEDRRWEDVHDLDDLNQHNLNEYAHFFETYKQLKSDDAAAHVVEVHGFKGKKEAEAAIAKAVTLYDEKYAQ